MLLVAILLFTCSCVFDIIGVIMDIYSINIWYILSIFTYLFGRICFVSIFTFRLYISFYGSSFALSTKLIRIFIIILISLFLCGIAGIIIFTLIINDNIISLFNPILSIISLIYFGLDFGVLIYILKLFSSKLFALMVNTYIYSKRYDDTLIPFITRITTLVMICILSTIFMIIFQSIFWFLIPNIGFHMMFISFDALINGYCIYYAINYNSKSYNICCILCNQCLYKICMQRLSKKIKHKSKNDNNNSDKTDCNSSPV